MAGLAAADETVRNETLRAGNFAVTIHLHSFLTSEERDALRQIGSSEDAMLTFIGGSDGHAAIAAAPGKGFFRDGMPVPSAVAMSQLPDAASARRTAIEACKNAAGENCVVLLEAAPGR